MSRRPPRLRRAAAGLGLLAVLAGCGQWGPASGPPAHGVQSARESPEPVHRPHRRADDLPFGAAARPPSLMVIPRIGVRAEVEQVDFLAVPADPRHVAWFKTGPAPGEPGTAAFDGHLDWTTGPAVFWELSKLQAGDEIRIGAADGQIQSWKVDLVQSVPYTSTPPDWLYASQGPPRISLITCGGSWLGQVYADRLLVRGVPAPS